MRSTAFRLSAVALALAATMALAATLGCGKGDPDENFRLWSNNEAGWDEMATFVGDSANELRLRVRAVEVLVDEGGQPSQALRVTNKAKDQVEVLLGLQPALKKMLENPNVKKQGHAKRVLFDMLSVLPDAKKPAIRKVIADWAFADMSIDDPAARITDKLGQKLRPEELEQLGEEGIPGAEIMLSKAIARDGVVGMLVALKTPASKKALIDGMRRYHKLKKDIKVTEGDLAAIQGTDSLDGFLYFLELYETRGASAHPDDQAAAKLAIAAAIQWTEGASAKTQIKEAWGGDKLKPAITKLLVGKNCDDRWWAAQMFLAYSGLDGLKEVLAKLPDDRNYGLEELANSDVKLMMTDLCAMDIKPLGIEKVRPLFEASLASPRVIERVLALRCLTTLGDDASLALLKNYRKDDKALVDPIIVPPVGSNMGVSDLAAVFAEVVEYLRAQDTLLAEGKIDADTAKWRKNYASYSFDRRGKVLAAYAEERAAEKIAHDKEKAAKGAAK
ncbi:MAG: hypothetical protein ACOYOB_12425 [Myxococcota bacterium]